MQILQLQPTFLSVRNTMEKEHKNQTLCPVIRVEMQLYVIQVLNWVQDKACGASL